MRSFTVSVAALAIIMAMSGNCALGAPARAPRGGVVDEVAAGTLCWPDIYESQVIASGFIPKSQQAFLVTKGSVSIDVTTNQSMAVYTRMLLTAGPGVPGVYGKLAQLQTGGRSYQLMQFDPSVPARCVDEGPHEANGRTCLPAEGQTKNQIGTATSLDVLSIGAEDANSSIGFVSTKVDFAPVQQIMSKEQPEGTAISSVSYYNPTRGITDRNVFKVPKECQRGALVSEAQLTAQERAGLEFLRQMQEARAHGTDALKPPVAPVAMAVRDTCEDALKKDCEDKRDNRRDCDHCVERIEKALKVHCSKSEEFKFCDGDAPPSPITDKCTALLEDDCAKFARKYNETKCYQCTQKAAGTKPDIACTAREEYTFCTYGPSGEPECIEELQKLCGKPWGGQKHNRTACLDCVVENEAHRRWVKANCTRAEVQKFC